MNRGKKRVLWEKGPRNIGKRGSRQSVNLDKGKTLDSLVWGRKVVRRSHHRQRRGGGRKKSFHPKIKGPFAGEGTETNRPSREGITRARKRGAEGSNRGGFEPAKSRE